MSKSPCFWLSTVCGSIIFLVLMIILITSFTYVEHDEYVFKKSTVSNTVFQDQVYETGRYLWGVDHTKVSFPSKYQLIDLELTVSNSDGVTIGIDMSFWYKLPKENLSKIYSKYGLNYKSQIISMSNAIIRNTAVQFSIDDFLSNRRTVRQTIANNISHSLAQNIYVEVPPYSCKLRNVNLPDTILATHLAAAVRLEENEKKQYEQQATVIRSETDKMVQQINANTTIILRTAEANKTTKIESANAKYDEIIGRSRGIGIADTVKILSTNDSYDKIDYTIRNNTVRHTFLKLMAILDNNQTKIVNLQSTAIVSI